MISFGEQMPGGLQDATKLAGFPEAVFPPLPTAPCRVPALPSPCPVSAVKSARSETSEEDEDEEEDEEDEADHSPSSSPEGGLDRLLIDRGLDPRQVRNRQFWFWGTPGFFISFSFPHYYIQQTLHYPLLV